MELLRDNFIGINKREPDKKEFIFLALEKMIADGNLAVSQLSLKTAN